MKWFVDNKKDLSIENLNRSYLVNKVTYWLLYLLMFFIGAFNALLWYNVYLNSLSWVELLRHFGKSLI